MAILVIDGHEALQAALESGLIPPAVQAAPLCLGYEAESGRLVLETKAEIGRSARKTLREAGVEFRRKRARDAVALGGWAEAIPTRDAPEPQLPLGEVLFTSEGDEGFLHLSGELLRLGSQGQRLGFFVDGQGQRRNLCRVPDPPYFAILRALDPDDPLRAFVPARAGGRVWVEIGAFHPLAARIEAEPGELVLVPHTRRAGGQLRPWLRVPDGPWIDLDAVSEVRLPPATTWTPSVPETKLQVELGLVRAPTRTPADLWVIRTNALAQVESLVRTVPEEVIARLRFATIEREDPLRGASQTLIVLRARRSAMGPPALDLDAEAYVPAPQIPDLYVPAGSVIDPPLRPGRIRELLADEDRVVWLARAEARGMRGHHFRRESLAEQAFAPLSDWIEYLIGSEDQLLEPWVRSTVFDFDQYVSINAEWAEGAARQPKQKREPKPRSREREVEVVDYEELPELAEIVDEAVVETVAALAELAPIEIPRSEAEVQLTELEASFCQLDTPLDDPERSGLWAELGNLQASLHRSREAGLCWSRAMWEAEGAGRPSHLSLARRWVESECVMLGYPDGGHMLGIVDVIEADLDEQMVRALAAEVIYAEAHIRAREDQRSAQADSLAGPPPPLEAEILARLQRFFANHGALLDLRALWLARSALARLAGDDRLALFQTRDFIVASLRDGVGLARNIPTFIRTHGNEGDASDLSRLGDELIEIRDVYLQTKRTRSTIESTYPEQLTHAYVHLVFAWGLARVGRAHSAREELASATQLLGPHLSEGDAVHRAAYLAYHARIEQALEGLAPGAPFSTDAEGPIAAREALTAIDRFKYNRLVMLSRILDPRQDVDAFERWGTKDEAPFEGLALLTDPEALAALYDRTLAALPKLEPQARALSLLELFEYIEALPEGLALPRLSAGVKHIATVPIEARPRLLRNVLHIAGYYDRSELIAAVLTSIERSDEALSEEQPAAYAELLSRSAPILRRSNFEDQLVRLLTKLEQRVDQDQDLGGVLARLHVAGAFASLGQGERVQPAFDAAYALLPELEPSKYQPLLREIAIALSRSSTELAIPGARSLLEFLPTTTDSMSTNTHYCLAVIQLMEAVVLSLASEDLALSEWARRWVEEDEHLLHRRIHRDLATSP